MKKESKFKRLFSLVLVFMLLSTLFAGVAGGEGDPPLTAPNTPSGLNATVVSGNQVNLSWNHDSVNEVEGFIILREQEGTAAVEIDTEANSTIYSDTGLTVDTTYTYRVRAYNGAGSSDYSNTVTVTTITPPSPPSNLVATLETDTRVNLTWNDNSDNETGFKIERRTGSGSFTQVTIVGANSTDFLDTGLTAGNTYTYRVRAYNAAGDSLSNEATVSTSRPTAPSGLTYTYVSTNEIRLAWTDNSNNETGFRIERLTGSGNFTEVGTVGANVTTFSNTGLSNNTQYTYRVYAYNAAGDSNASNQLVVRTGIPTAPTNLVTTRISSNQINLSWTDNSNNETGFKIERKHGTGSYSLVTTVGANVTSYSNTNLSSNTQYTYRVRATNAAGDSANSNESTSSTGIVPNAPSDLVANTVSTSRIDLAWKDNANNETGFKIERKHGTGSFTQIATVKANVTSYSNTGLTNNREYTYRVRAYNAAGDSAYSNEAKATTGVLPAAPTNLKAEPLSDKQIKLTWKDNANNETGFRIERKKGSGSYSQIATLSANTVTYTDTGLDTKTEYTYRVRAYNIVGNSAYSNEAKATTMGIPTAPTNLSATAASSNRITLSWRDRSDDESGFRIERKRGTGSYSQIATVTANTTTYTDTNVDPETRYTYRVRAYNVVGNSAYSNEASVTTPQQIKIKLRVGQTSYQVNGRTLVMDTSPIILESRTLLPIRFVAEALGAKVDWNEKDLKATITLENKRVELWVGSNTARVNGVQRPIDPDNNRVIPTIVPPGRTMMPLRFISEALGCKVDWNSQTREIDITYPAP